MTDTEVAPQPVQRRGDPTSPLRTLATQVTANASMALGLLFYMGWVYTNAFFGYFHLNPLDLEIGVQEYALRGLNLFSPTLVVGGVAGIVIVAAAFFLLAERGPITAPMAPAIEGLRRSRPALVRNAGIVSGVAGLLLISIIRYVDVPTYAVLALLAAGALLTTWPSRAGPAGRYGFSLAVVLALLCGLWAASLYADGRGLRAARALARDLPGRTAAVVYSTQRLALSGPGVQVETLPRGNRFRYRYTGLHLLVARGGRFYLLPVKWQRNLDPTYVVMDDENTRVDLYAGLR